MTERATDPRFANLKAPRRIWTVSAIHGNTACLQSVHKEIYESFTPGDRLVYFGNYIGGTTDASSSVRETLDDLLHFRKCLMARPGILMRDIVYLRGRQEEIWQKLLQLQFARDPAAVFEWMLENGAAQTLRDYGGDIEDGRRACREGILSLTRWTGTLRRNIRNCPGHGAFMSALRRAAFTEGENPLLFVHAGIDPAKPLSAQQDSFWWENNAFDNLHDAYAPFSYVIRGFDPKSRGIAVNGVTMSLDGATEDHAHRPVTCSLLAGDGELIDVKTV